MKKPPDKIYLQFHGDDETASFDDDIDPMHVTHSMDRVYSQDIEYVRDSSVSRKTIDRASERICRTMDLGTVDYQVIQKILTEELRPK